MAITNNLTNNKNNMEVISMNSGMKVSVEGEQLVVASDVFGSNRKCAVAMVDIANKHNTMLLEGRVNYTIELVLDDNNTSWLNERIHDIASYDAEWAVYNVLESMDIDTKGQVVDYVAEGQVVTITVVNPRLAQLRKVFNKQSDLFYDEVLMAKAQLKEQQAKARQERKARKLAQIEEARLEEARMTEVEKAMIAISNNEISIEDALAQLTPAVTNNATQVHSIGGLKRIADRNRKAYRKIQGFKYSELVEECGLVVMKDVKAVVVKEAKVAKKQVKVIYKEGDRGYTAPKGTATPKAPQNQGKVVKETKVEKEAGALILSKSSLNSMYDYIMSNKVSSNKMARHSSLVDNDNFGSIRLDGNGEYTRANRSASVSTNNLNGGLPMNLQALASNISMEEIEIAKLKKLTVKQLTPIAKSLGITCISSMRKAELVEAIAKKTGLIECNLTQRSEDSASRSAVEAIVKALMSNLYSSVTLVERFNLNDKSGALIPSVIFQNVKGVRLVEELGQKDYSVKNYMIENRDDQDNVTSTQIVRVDGTNNNCRVNGVILVNIKEAKECDIQRIEAFIALDEDGKRFLTTDASDKRIISGRYVFAGTNTSGKKHCSFFMKELSKDYAKKDLQKDIDRLTGGAWLYALKQLDDARKSGQKLVTPADYAKVNERVGLDNCSPMLKGTNINSLFIIGSPVDCGPQFDPAIEAFMERNHFEIPRNAMDGCTGGVHYKVIMRMCANYGIKISKAQAMRISMQTRTTVITDKRLAVPQDENMILASVLAYLDKYVTEEEDLITLVDYKRGITLTGREIKRLLDIENLSSNEKLSKEEMKDFNWIKSVIKDIELITSKDEAKMINWDVLNVTEPCESPVEMFILDASRVTEAKHSNQLFNKTSKDDPEATCDYAASQAAMDFLQADTDVDRVLTMDKDGRIAGQPFSNAYAVNYGRAITDKMVFGNKLSTLNNYVISKVGKANVKCNSYYLKIATFDASLFEFMQVITSKEVDYQAETGEIVKVNLNVVYNPTIDKDIKEKEALIDEADMTDEEKFYAKEALRVTVNIKYPAQGTKEYGGLYLMRSEEIIETIKSTDLISSAFTKGQAIRKIKSCPHNVLYLFGDTGLLVQCAGSDCDGDAMASILNQLNYVGNSDVPCVGAVDISSGRRMLGYVSLIMKKIANEGSTAAVIGRHNPDRIAKNKRNKRRNTVGLYNKKAAKAQKNIKGVVRTNNLINNENLEASLTEVFDRARALVEGEECIISSKDFMNLEYIPREWDITDFVGLYQATSVFGDNVGITITLVSVLTMCDLEYFFQDDKFNFEAASNLLLPLRSAVNSKEERQVERYTTVFTEEKENVLEAVNTSGVTRKYIAVLNSSINEWAKKVSMLPEDTTVEEWTQLVNDFDIIGRNLGETSIDICKDPDKKNDLSIEKLINKNYRCVGNMKPSYLSSNLSKVLYGKENHYSIDCGRFDPEAGDKTVLPDSIGAIKLTIKEVAEEFMSIRTKAYSDEARFNLKSYSQYSNIINQRVNGNTVAILEAILNYIKVSNKVSKDDKGNIISEVAKMDNTMLRNIEGAIFNMAKLEGIAKEDVIALAIQLSFMYESNKTNSKGNFVPSKEFNKKMNYASLLKQTAALFPEVFLAEYIEKGNNILEVALDYDICDGMFFNGDVIEFTDGWNKERTIHVLNNYTGKALVENDTLFALYNAYDHVAQNDWVILPICKFLDDNTSREFIENEGTFCVRKRVTNAEAVKEAEAKGIKDVKKEFELVLSSADKKTVLASTYLNNLEGMSGHVYKNASVMGYEIDNETNYFVIAQR